MTRLTVPHCSWAHGSSRLLTAKRRSRRPRRAWPRCRPGARLARDARAYVFFSFYPIWQKQHKYATPVVLIICPYNQKTACLPAGTRRLPPAPRGRLPEPGTLAGLLSRIRRGDLGRSSKGEFAPKTPRTPPKTSRRIPKDPHPCVTRGARLCASVHRYEIRPGEGNLVVKWPDNRPKGEGRTTLQRERLGSTAPRPRRAEPCASCEERYALPPCYALRAVRYALCATRCALRAARYALCAR